VVGGVERHYLLVVPDSYDGTVAVPLLFVFHGRGGVGADIEKTCGFAELAARKNFIAVFPDGLGKEWNGGRTTPVSLESARSDDVDFVSRMIDQLQAQYRIDPKHIFASGSSNGAIFCNTLAARLSSRIAAIGPVSGSLGESIPRRFRAPSPVSVISFNGTDDHLVPYAGEHDSDRGVMSIPDTIAFWVKADGCNPSPVMTTDPQSPLDDGLTIIRMRYDGGAAGSEVLAFIIGHGGHTWPGNHTDPTWAKTAGKTAMSISATELMWDFFERHSKP
jgi:polyhydroxybutyrate depolymerase